MTRYQYQGTPPRPPAPVVSTISGSTTSAKAGNYSFWLQYRNRAGYSQVSDRVDVSLSAGQGLSVALPANVLPENHGCYIVEFVILASRSTNPTEACVVATIPGYEMDQVTPFGWTSLALIFDEDYELFKVLETEAQLPDNALNGARRYVESTNQIVAWHLGLSSWKVVVPAQFNTYLASDTGDRGANEDLSAIEDPSAVIYPVYASQAGGEGIPVGYWLVNNESADIAQGTRIGMTVEWNGVDVSAMPGIVGGLNLRFLGYVNILTGALDTANAEDTGDMPLIGEVIEYQGPSTAFVLPKPLPPNYAYLLTVAPNIQSAAIGNRLSRGSTLSFSPEFYADFATYSPDDVLGSYIAARSKRRRIVPDLGLNAIALPGSGSISLPTGGSMKFDGRSDQAVPSLAVDTADQKIVIAINGTCFVANTIPSAAELRAIVGTLDGVGRATGWSSPVTLSSTQRLKIDLVYPTAIRADYPDVIANSADGNFNATWVRIYVKSVATDEITYYESLVTPQAESEEIMIGALAGVSIGSLPSRPLAFGLYEPDLDEAEITAETGSSVFSSGDYQIAIAFRYSNTVTSISHDTTLGCILELSGSISTLFERSQYWAEAVETAAQLKGVPQAEVSAYQTRYLGATETPWTFHPDEVGAEDSSTLIPDWLTALQPGRWLESASNRLLVDDEIPTTGGRVGDVTIVLKVDTEDADHGKVYRRGLSSWTYLGKIGGIPGPPGEGGSAELPPTEVLTDGATIAIDASLSQSYSVVLGGNRTLANPTNLESGMKFEVALIQDSVGGRDISFGSAYRFSGTPTFVTDANKLNILSCRTFDGTNLFCTVTSGFDAPIPATLRIIGAPFVDASLVASVSDEDGTSTVTISYQWQESSDDGETWTALSGETNVSLVLTSGHAGKLIRVLASYTDEGGNPESLISPPTVEIVDESVSTGFSSAIAPMFGAVGMTQIVSAYTDDDFVQLPDLDLTFPFYGVNFTSDQIYVGANGYITFGYGSDAYSTLNAVNPGVALHLCSGDRSMDAVYYRKVGDTLRIRYEGYTGRLTSDPRRIWEVKFFPDGTIMVVSGENMDDSISIVTNGSYSQVQALLPTLTSNSSMVLQYQSGTSDYSIARGSYS